MLPENRTVVQAWVPCDLADALRSRAVAAERSVSAEVRLALREHLNDEAPVAEPVLRETSTAGQGRHDSSR